MADAEGKENIPVAQAVPVASPYTATHELTRKRVAEGEDGTGAPDDACDEHRTRHNEWNIVIERIVFHRSLEKEVFVRLEVEDTGVSQTRLLNSEEKTVEVNESFVFHANPDEEDKCHLVVDLCEAGNDQDEVGFASLSLKEDLKRLISLQAEDESVVADVTLNMAKKDVLKTPKLLTEGPTTTTTTTTTITSTTSGNHNDAGTPNQTSSVVRNLGSMDEEASAATTSPLVSVSANTTPTSAVPHELTESSPSSPGDQAMINALRDRILSLEADKKKLREGVADLEARLRAQVDMQELLEAEKEDILGKHRTEMHSNREQWRHQVDQLVERLGSVSKREEASTKTYQATIASLREKIDLMTAKAQTLTVELDTVKRQKASMLSEKEAAEALQEKDEKLLQKKVEEAEAEARASQKAAEDLQAKLDVAEHDLELLRQRRPEQSDLIALKTRVSELEAESTQKQHKLDFQNSDFDQRIKEATSRHKTAMDRVAELEAAAAEAAKASSAALGRTAWWMVLAAAAAIALASVLPSSWPGPGSGYWMPSTTSSSTWHPSTSQVASLKQRYLDAFSGIKRGHNEEISKLLEDRAILIDKLYDMSTQDSSASKKIQARELIVLRTALDGYMQQVADLKSNLTVASAEIMAQRAVLKMNEAKMMDDAAHSPGETRVLRAGESLMTNDILHNGCTKTGDSICVPHALRVCPEGLVHIVRHPQLAQSADNPDVVWSTATSDGSDAVVAPLRAFVRRFSPKDNRKAAVHLSTDYQLRLRRDGVLMLVHAEDSKVVWRSSRRSLPKGDYVAYVSQSGVLTIEVHGEIVWESGGV